MQRAVGNDRNGPAQSIDADVAAPDVSQILGRHAGLQARHALQPCIGPDPVQTQEQPRLKHRALEGFVGGRTFQHVGEAQSQISFLDHVEQSRHRPSRIEFRLERLQHRWKHGHHEAKSSGRGIADIGTPVRKPSNQIDAAQTCNQRSGPIFRGQK